MGQAINRVNLVAIIIAFVALVAGLGYILSQPISAQGTQPGIETRLQEAVDSGKITQAAANERLKAYTRMSQNKSESKFHSKPQMTVADLEARLQAAVEAGKLTQDEAKQKLESFSTKKDGVCEKGTLGERSHSRDTDARIKRGLESGALTQDQANAMREKLSQLSKRKSA